MIGLWAHRRAFREGRMADHNHDDLAFDFIREAARSAPATVTDREIAQLLSENEGGSQEDHLQEARDSIRRLEESGRIAVHNEEAGAMSAVYPRPVRTDES
jgi:hypothetical protein